MKIRQNIEKLQNETTSPELKEAASNLLVEFNNIDDLNGTSPVMNEALTNAKYKEFVAQLNETEINESDKGALAFRTKVNNELNKEFITEHLGINESIKLLEQSNYAGHPTLRYLVESFSKNLDKPEYLLVESYMNTFAKFSYIPVIRDSFKMISENVKTHQKDILLYATLDKLQNTYTNSAFAGSNAVLENHKSLINDYLDNRTEASKNVLIESLTKFSFDRGVKNLIDVLNTVNETNGFDIHGFSSTCDVSNVYSLMFESGNNMYFNVGQSLYMVEGNSDTLDDVKVDDLKLVTVDDVEKIAEGHDYLLNVDFVLRNNVAISENLITIPYGRSFQKTIKIYEADAAAEGADAEDELILDEAAKMSVIDQGAAIKALKKIGVVANPHSENKDIIFITKIKDKNKMKKWLNDTGWEDSDVKDSIPELYKMVFEAEEEEKEPEIVIEMDGEKMDIEKVEEKLGKGALMNPADRETSVYIRKIYEAFANFGKIDIAKRFTSKISNNQYANVFKIEESFYIHKFDGVNNVQLFENVNALTARDNIFEFLGYDISESFVDLIAQDSAAVKVNEKLKAEFESNISKLEEQRDALLNHENEAVRNSTKIVALVENLNEELDKVNESYRLFNEGEEELDVEDLAVDECGDEMEAKLKEAEEEAEEIIEEMKNFIAVKKMFEEEIDDEKSESEENHDEELEDELVESNMYLKFKSIFEDNGEGLNKEGEVDDKPIHKKNVGDKIAGGTVTSVDDATGDAIIALDKGGTKTIKEGEELEDDDKVEEGKMPQAALDALEKSGKDVTKKDDDKVEEGEDEEEEIISEMRRFLAVRTLQKLTEGEDELEDELEDEERELSEMKKFVTLKRIFEDLAEEGKEPTDKVDLEKEIISEKQKFDYWKTISEDLAEEGREPSDKVELEKEIISEMNAFVAVRSMFEEEEEEEMIDEMYSFFKMKNLFEAEEEEETEEMKEARKFLKLRKLAEGVAIEEDDEDMEAAVKETNRFNEMKKILEGKMPREMDDLDKADDEIKEAEDNEGDSPEDKPKKINEFIDSIQTTDPKAAVAELKKIGVTAKTSNDEVEILKVKDKDKFKKWLEDSYYEKADTKEVYPDLYKFLYESDEVEEGNAFGEAVANAKKDNKDSFDLEGKTYKVTEDGEYELVGNLEDDEEKLEETEDNEGDSPEDKPKEISEGDMEELEEEENDILESIITFRKIKNRINEKKNESEDDEEIAELTEEEDKLDESINNLRGELKRVSLLIEGSEMKTLELSDKKTEITPKRRVGTAVTVKGEKGKVTAIGGAEEIATVALDKGGSAVIAEGFNVGDSVSHGEVDATISGIANGMITLTGNFPDGEQTKTVPESELKRGEVTPIGESKDEFLNEGLNPKIKKFLDEYEAVWLADEEHNSGDKDAKDIYKKEFKSLKIPLDDILIIWDYVILNYDEIIKYLKKNSIKYVKLPDNDDSEGGIAISSI